MSDDALVRHILTGGKGAEADVYADSFEQAARVQDLLHAIERIRTGNMAPPTNDHGPESHRGSRFEPAEYGPPTWRYGLGPNTAPAELHLNLKGGSGSDSYEVDLYFPPPRN